MSARATLVTTVAPASTNQTDTPATARLGGLAPAVKSVSRLVKKSLLSYRSKLHGETWRPSSVCFRPAVETSAYWGHPDQHASPLAVHYHRSAVCGIRPHAHHPHSGHLPHQPHRVPGIITPCIPGVLQLPEHWQRVQQRYRLHPPCQVWGNYSD